MPKMREDAHILKDLQDAIGQYPHSDARIFALMVELLLDIRLLLSKPARAKKTEETTTTHA